ncbi:unnamed protein product [Schistocephalus solidus]|uniref:Uncharacterized protein n=1 Tax=Schistocephalus solidus TaxID=70667 RepID=A0A3P7CXG1_SCHSO|nr:unnamed protein product [Schistocephalus solidus]
MLREELEEAERIARERQRMEQEMRAEELRRRENQLATQEQKREKERSFQRPPSRGKVQSPGTAATEKQMSAVDSPVPKMDKRSTPYTFVDFLSYVSRSVFLSKPTLDIEAVPRTNANATYNAHRKGTTNCQRPSKREVSGVVTPTDFDAAARAEYRQESSRRASDRSTPLAVIRTQSNLCPPAADFLSAITNPDYAYDGFSTTLHTGPLAVVVALSDESNTLMPFCHASGSETPVGGCLATCSQRLRAASRSAVQIYKHQLTRLYILDLGSLRSGCGWPMIPAKSGLDAPFSLSRGT